MQQCLHNNCCITIGFQSIPKLVNQCRLTSYVSSDYSTIQKMTVAAGSLLELIQYLDRVSAEEPKDVAQAIRYVKNSVIMLAQSGELPNDQVQMSTFYDKIDKFVDIIADTWQERGEKIDQLEKEVQLSLKEISELKKEISELKSSLLVGQVASKLEKEIVKLLLKDAGLNRTITINQLSCAVSPYPDRVSKRQLNATREQVVQINKSWTKFEADYQDADALYRVIDTYKMRRNKDAHPNMPLSEATEQLTKFDLKDKESVDLMLHTLESMKVDHI